QPHPFLFHTPNLKIHTLWTPKHIHKPPHPKHAIPMPSTTTTTTTTTPGNPGPPPAPTTDPATAAVTTAAPTTTPTTLLWAYELRRENIELAARLAAAEATIAALQHQLKDVREELQVQVQVQKVCALKEREWEEMERRVQGVEDSVRGEVAVLAGLVEGVQGRVAGLMTRREGGLGGEEGRKDDVYGEEGVLVPDSMSVGAAAGGAGAGGLGYMDGVGVSGGLRLGMGMGRGGGLSSTVEGESESTSWESGSLDCGGCRGGRGDGSVVMVAGMASRMRGEVCKVAAAAVQNDADGAFGSGSGRKINSQSVRDWVEVLENRGMVRKRKRARRFIPIVPADEEDVLIARAMMVGH
ncbi:uncharacterized protein BO95DRAFT_499881, partial [Aspergillus brunneoviolaceus CBS 621.78]